MISIPLNQQRTIEQLRDIPITERGDRSSRWQGVSHFDLIQKIVEQS